ncbi:MAG: hypothetical protein SZ59_C0002G0176 [candidate division TM6 bacterium GW2011_GWF2_28_16]|nr:MAG: hypothetical protein SZ59_C0002G0176 [candidate division TM6 bacterium GW2011_GWF2_28_16]
MQLNKLSIYIKNVYWVASQVFITKIMINNIYFVVLSLLENLVYCGTIKLIVEISLLLKIFIKERVRVYE